MFAKQSYWLKPSQAFFKLGHWWAFQISPDRFPLSYWAHVDWLAPGGLIIMLPGKTRPTPNLGCLPWR